MAKGAYIGATGPIYTSTQVTSDQITIKQNNIRSVFGVINGPYGFTEISTNNTGDIFFARGTNATFVTELIALYDMTISFDYKHAFYYKSGAEFIFTIDDQEIYRASYDTAGTTATTKSYSGELKKGQRIKFQYTSMTGSTSFYAWFGKMKLTYTYTETTQTGTGIAARKITKGYVGVNTEFKTYEKRSQNYSVTTEDILLQLFDTTSDYSNCNFTDGKIRMSDYNTVTLIAKSDIEMSFTGSIGSRTGSRTAYLYVYRKLPGGSSTTLLSISGSISGATGQCDTFFLPKGAQLQIKTEQASTNGGQVYDIVATAHTSVVVSTTYKEVARKIRKAYVGVNGVARLCWSTGIMDRTGSAKLRRAKMRMAECNNDTHAFFIGGYESYLVYDSNDGLYDIFSDVDIYDKNLTMTQVDLGNYRTWFDSAEIIGNTVYTAYWGNRIDTSTFTVSIGASPGYQCGASCRTSNYAWFAGGTTSLLYWKTVNSSGTIEEVNYASGYGNHLFAGASCGTYAMFAGGGLASGGTQHYSKVSAYDDALTRKYPADLSEAKTELAGTETYNHALFAGGFLSLDEGFSNTVEAYDSTLTKYTLAPLSQRVSVLSATSANGCAVFAGGVGSGGSYEDNPNTWSDYVDIYDSSLTKHIGESLSSPRYYLSAAAIGNTVLIAGGLSLDNSQGNNTEYTDVIDVYTLNI